MISADLQNSPEFKMRPNSSLGLNTKPEKIPPKPQMPSLPAAERLQPLSLKLLKSQRAPLRRSTQSRGVTWQNPALLLTRGWRREPECPRASPGQGFSPSPAGPASLGCRRRLAGLEEPAPRSIRDQKTHSQHPRVSGALLAAGKEPRPWVSSHDMLQFLSQGHLPDLAFPPQKKKPYQLWITRLVSLP